MDINDVLTSNCMNLTQVRNSLNRFNDSFKHYNYKPKIIKMTEHITFKIVTWSFLALVLLGLTLIFIRCIVKKKQVNPINFKEDLQMKEMKTQKAADEKVI